MTSLKRTPLYESHKALGAKIVPFAGWEMPVQYAGIVEEHRAVRERAGAFDVSHMGEVRFKGPRAAEAVQRIVTNDVGKLAVRRAMYTVMCLPSGGIVDDCIVYRHGTDDYLIVVNASNAAKDYAWMRDQAGAICAPVDESDATGLIAVQGPAAPGIVAGLAGEPIDSQTVKNQLAWVTIAGAPCIVARTGYTGEDGFEVFTAWDQTRKVWDAILAAGVPPIGLGARDTLRLEARLSLYGNDIDETTTPYEAGLGWVVKPEAGDFVGKEALAAQKAAGVTRRLVGFVVRGRGIARHDYAIYAPGGTEPVGKVTSGTTGPSLGYAVGMGYVPAAMSQPGTMLEIDCRGKRATAEIVAGPFYRRQA